MTSAATNGWCAFPTNDDAPILYVFGGGDVDEDDGSVGFRVVASHAITQNIWVKVATEDGSATAGYDYDAVSRDIMIPAGFTTFNVSVAIIDDESYEGGEDFTLEISDPYNASLHTTPEAVATIIDDDAEPFPGAVPNLTAKCIDGEVTVSWRRPAQAPGLTSYTYRIADSNRSSATVYASGSINDPDQTSATVPVTDTSVPYYAWVRTNLRNTWVHTEFICTQSPLVVSISDAEDVIEGETLEFEVSMSRTDTSDVTVKWGYALELGTVDPSDFTYTDLFVEIPAGSTTATISIGAVDDGKAEPKETIAVELHPSRVFSRGTRTAEGSISDAPTRIFH